MTAARFWVREIASPFRTIREPYQVIDGRDNRIVDEYASKRAATMDAAERNAREAARPALVAKALQFQDEGADCCANHAGPWESAVRSCETKATHVVRVGNTYLPMCGSAAYEFHTPDGPRVVMSFDAARFEQRQTERAALVAETTAKAEAARAARAADRDGVIQ